MFERRHQALLPRAAFLRRLGRYAGMAVAVVACSLAIGVAGYRGFEGLPWVDAVLNAAMILGGMGPVSELHSPQGKLFAALYALYSGLVVILVAGLLLAPVFHRILHHFHVDLRDEGSESVGAPREIPRPLRGNLRPTPLLDNKRERDSMDAIEAIMTRRSVRDYKSGAVSRETIDRLLECAMQAPSAGNQQPWHFVVLTDRQKMIEAAGLHPYCQMIKVASLGILVCGDTSGLKHPLYWQQDCAAAVENLLLAAHAMGLGAVWTGIYPTEDRVTAFQQWLGLPDHVLPFALIPIGYPAEEPAQVERYDPKRVHMNGW